MTSTAHALVGAVIAVHFQNLALAAPLALTSHFMMDSIPHWDFGTDWRSRPKQATAAYAIAETLFGMSLAWYLFRNSAPAVVLAVCIIVALLPDWLEAPWYIFFAHQKQHGTSKHAGIIEKISYAFYKVPNVFHTKAKLPFGIITQVVTVAFFLFIFLHG